MNVELGDQLHSPEFAAHQPLDHGQSLTVPQVQYPCMENVASEPDGLKEPFQVYTCVVSLELIPSVTQEPGSGGE